MYYYLPVPEIPTEYLNRDKEIKLIKYLVKEMQCCERGTPIALIETNCAKFEISSNGNGFVAELFCKPDELIKVKDSIARIRCDGEDIPYHKPYSILKLLEEKPADE